ncbi:MAG: NAD(P)/FAD-dependent oxidoreductase [Deltaproteobacteria bacterium]|nr:NAD(P)/FAD-dependent oxidoreductase [Deltaproteobacteria bacterium]
MNVDFMLGQRAISLDTDAQKVQLAGGEAVPFDGLVIATGGQVRELPNQPRMDGIYTLRTIDDSLAIRAARADKPRVAVIGAGFIGSEVAASARQLGLEVTVIEALEAPLAQSLAPRVGSILQQTQSSRRATRFRACSRHPVRPSHSNRFR